MYRLLLIDQNQIRAKRLTAYLCRLGIAVTATASINDGADELQRRTQSFAFVVVVASGVPAPWLAVLRKLKRTCRSTYFFHRPLFLIVFHQKCNPSLRLRIERTGVRYVRQ